MDLIKLNLAYLNLSLTANKILFRAKYEPKKKAELDKQVADLDQVREVLTILEARNRVLERKLLDLHEENLRLTRMNEDLKLIINL